MKKKSSRFLLTMAFLPILAFGVFFIARPRNVPSEAEMLADFKTHKAVFRKLAQMARSDRIDSVSAGYGKYYSANSFNSDQNTKLPTKRVEEYMILMRQAGVKGIYGLRGGLPLRFSIAGGRRGIFNGWSLGFAYYRAYRGGVSRATPLVASAYRSAPSRKMLNDFGNSIYSKIEPNWYLYRHES